MNVRHTVNLLSAKSVYDFSILHNRAQRCIGLSHKILIKWNKVGAFIYFGAMLRS